VPQDEFLRRVLEHVDRKPRTVLDIAKRAGVSWQAAKRALETLSDLGVIKARRIGERTLYYKVKGSGDTWFDIPLDDESKKILYYIYRRAEKLKGGPLGKTQAQKIAVKVVQKASLPIPTPRYLYGRITLLTFESVPEEAKIEPELAATLEPHIREAVGWARDLEGKAIAAAQYEEEDNRLHMTLMKIEKVLEQLLVGQATPRELKDLLLDLLAYSPDDELVVEAVKELISHLWLLDEGVKGILRFKELFDLVRHLMAEHLMYVDLREAGYSDEELEGLLRKKQHTLRELQYYLSWLGGPRASEETMEAVRKIQGGEKDARTEQWRERGLKVLRELNID